MLLLWRLTWRLVYHVFGVYIGYVTINNGILFNSLKLRRRYLVRASSIRFRLWGNTRKIIVSDLTITLPTGSSKSLNAKVRSVPLGNESFSIFPESRFAKAAVKAVVAILSKLDVEIRSCDIYKGDSHIHLGSIQFNARVKRNPDSRRKLHLSATLLRASAKFQKDEKEPKLTSGSLRFLTSYSLCMEKGTLSNGTCRLSIVDCQVSVFDLIKLMNSQPTEEHTKTHGRKQHTRESIIQRLTFVHNCLLGTFNEISFSIDNLKVIELPFLPASQDSSLETYFNQINPSTSVKVSVRSLAVHLTKIRDTTAGFDVLFDSKDDYPFEVTLSSSILEFSFYNDGADFNLHLSREFLTIPNFSCTFKTNIPANLIKGVGLHNGALELFCSCSSPVLDLSVEQLALVSYNYVAVKKLMRLNKLSSQKEIDYLESSESPEASASEDDDATRTESDGNIIGHAYKDMYTSSNSSPLNQLLTEAYYLLEESYPRVDVKLTIEQPRTVLSSYNVIENRLQFLVLSYSMMILQVQSINFQEYDTKCHVLHPYMTFNEKIKTSLDKENICQEFCGFSEAKVTCRVMKNLKIQPAVEMHGAFLNLTRPKVLHGISHLLNETTKLFSSYSKYGHINKQLDGELVKNRDRLYHRKPTNEAANFTIESLGNHLPSWLVAVTFKLSETNIWLGSTSPLLRVQDFDKIFKLDSNDANETETKTHLHVSNISVKLDRPEFGEEDYTSSVTTFSHDTLAVETDVPFWKTQATITDFKLVVIDKKRLKSSLVFEIPTLQATIKAITQEQKPQILIESECNEVNIAFDRYKAFALFGLVHLIKHTLVKPLKRLSRKFKKSSRSLNFPQSQQSKLKVSEFIKSSLYCKKVVAVVGLFESFKVRAQILNLNVGQKEESFCVQSLFLRVLISSFVQTGYWDRVLCVDSLSCRINDPSDKELCVIETPLIRLLQPHNFVVYKLFDSLSIFVKIVKHLAKAVCEKDQSVIVYPSESEPLNVPPIRLKSNQISFFMEDDPFESDLGMIYQLGLVEQKKRLDLLNLHEQSLDEFHGNDDTADERLEVLLKTMEALWIRKVKAYKNRLLQEMGDNQEFLFGAEPEVPKADNLRVRPYQNNAPLLHIILSGVDLNVSPPRFAQKDLPQFIHDNGQGVPKETTYNLMLPILMKLAVNELRIHLRDYPLPLLFLPHMVDATGKGRALLMHGNLVICEAMPLNDHSIRRLQIQLAELSKTSCQLTDGFDSLVVMKSLAPVKLYTDMDILFDSEQPSRFVWGQSYQFGIQQVMLKFDQFSKPPIDPSPKLGFWDKMRLIMHGHVSIKTGKRASLEVAFKGGRDPYNVFGDATGFILRFKDQVVWNVNENDNSLEFFDVNAQKVSWYIPNYLSSPLVCWCRPSSQYSFLPASSELITSCYGYYLQHDTRAVCSNQDVCEKNVVVLSGGVNLKVGFLLQRETVDHKVTDERIPHYEVSLNDPKYTKKGHDSYRKFRSTRVHMAISLIAHTEESYNTIHLTPMAFKHFFAWWHLFAGNTMLPVRRGKLFGEEHDKAKFSENLYTNKFLFHLKNLFIGHVHKIEEAVSASTNDEFECIGLRAKVDDFLVDLHQRKEQVIDVNEDLSRRNKVMKMLFNIGEVVLSKIDLRTLHAVFNQEVYASGMEGSVRKASANRKNFDKDWRWYDHRDYIEAFVPTAGAVLRSVDIEPLMFTERFSYIRDSNDGSFNFDWGNEETHKCMLHLTDIYTTQIQGYTKRIDELKRIHAKSKATSNDKLKKNIECLSKLIGECKAQRRKSVRCDSVTSIDTVKEKFHNRFVLISMFLKWNEDVRNQFMKYLHFVQLNSRLRKFLSYGLLSMLEEALDGNETIAETFSLATSRGKQDFVVDNINMGKFDSSHDRLMNFDKIVREVRDKETVLEDYRIEIISPQIQLHTKEVDDAVVLITAPLLESKIFSVVMEKEKHSNAKALETRYGCLLQDASVFVFQKSESSDSLCFEEQPYGTTTSWPPFLGIETCKSLKDTLEEQTLIDQMSLMITYDQIYALGKSIDQMEGIAESDDQDEEFSSVGNRLRVDVPDLVIRSTSKQYFTLYVTVLSLILYMEPLTAEHRERVLKLKFSIDFEDFNSVHKRLKSLHKYLSITNTLLRNYSFRHKGYMDNEALNEYLHLMEQKSSLTEELLLTLQTLFTGDIFNNSSSTDVENWRIAADKITLHMLKDDRSPILDLIIEDGRYKRVVKDDGSNDNSIEIKNIKGITLLDDAYYETFLEPLTQPKDNLITVNWSMSRPIGGIKVMDYFEIDSLPLNVRIDEETGRLLMKFVFYTDDGELEESPILRIADQAEIENLGHNSADEEEETNSNSSKLDLVRAGSLSSRKLKLGSQRSPSLNSPLSKSAEFDEEVELMLSRSKKYISIVKLVSRSFEILISLRMKNGVKKLLNVTDFLLVLPEWEIEKQIISLLDVANLFKKLVIKTLIQHSGRLFRNKFSTMQANRKRLSDRVLGRPSKKIFNVKLLEVDDDTGSLALVESE